MTGGIILRIFLVIFVVAIFGNAQPENTTDELETSSISSNEGTLSTGISEDHSQSSVTTHSLVTEEQPTTSSNTGPDHFGPKSPGFNPNCQMDQPIQPMPILEIKYFNQSCKDDSECAPIWSDHSMVCRNGLCDCAENYVLPPFSFGQIRRCEPAPAFYLQLCTTACRKPFVCKPITKELFQMIPGENDFPTPPQFPTSPQNSNGFGQQSNTPPIIMDESSMGGPPNGGFGNNNGFMQQQTDVPSNQDANANGFMPPVQPSPFSQQNDFSNQNRHSSMQQHQNIGTPQGNGRNFVPPPRPPPRKFCQCEKPYQMIDFACVLVCKEDEIYDDLSASCVKKCKSDEVQLQNHQCKPLVSIGGSCDDVRQCKSAFSECKNNLCSCRSAGFKQSGDSCQPLSLKCPYGDALKENDENVVCTLTSDKPCPTCPPRSPVDSCPENYYCLVTVNHNIGESENATGHCCVKSKVECPVGEPHETATCDTTKLNPFTSDKNAFCPPESHFCYQSAVVDGSSKLCCPLPCPAGSLFLDNQCYPIVQLGDPCARDEQCTMQHAKCVDGVCKCADKSIEAGSRSYKFCEANCDSDTELSLNNHCYSTLKLNDDCENQEWRCPMGTMCDKQKKCTCVCGFIPLGNICAPPPVCFQPHLSMAFQAKSSVKGAPDYAKKRQLQMPTPKFCRIPGKMPPTSENLVDECEPENYCSRYLQTLGLCCPKPPRLCPDGRPPNSNKTCSVGNSPCERKEFCYFYMPPTDDLLSEEGICCPASF